MNPAIPITAEQRKRDEEQINLLSIFHFVMAGLFLLGVAFIGLHYAFMHMVFSRPELWKSQNPPPFSPADFKTLFAIIYSIVGVFVVIACLLNVLSGVFMRQRKHKTFSLVVAALDCLQIPLGTALGVFTFVVLLRDSVRQLYESG
jgi:ABC-type phosphate transport system permease subunit